MEEEVSREVEEIIRRLKKFGNVEVLGTTNLTKSVNYSNKKIKEVKQKRNLEFMIRISKNRKYSFGITTEPKKSILDSIVKNLNKNTKLEGGIYLPKKGKAYINLFDEEVYNVGIDKLIKIGKILNKTKYEVPSSSVMTNHRTYIYGNENEIKSFEATSFGVDISIKHKDNVVYHSNRDIHLFDVEKIREEAEYMAKRFSNRKKIKTMKKDVIFEKDALISLLSTLLTEFEGPTIYNKIDRVLKNMNKKMFDKKLTLRTVANIDMVGSYSFDMEGNPSDEKYLVKNGVVKGILCGRFLGRKYKQKKYFNAASLNIPTPIRYGNIIIERGKNSVEGDAILVNGAMGWHTVDLATGNVSISISNGLLQKEREEIPIKNGMISFNIFDAFKSIEIDNKREKLHNFFLPKIRIKNVQFVG